MQLELANLKRDWIDDAVTRFMAATKLQAFTTDDLHKIIPEPSQRNYWGSLMARLKKEKRIRKIGFRVSERPSANSRPISLWESV